MICFEQRHKAEQSQRFGKKTEKELFTTNVSGAKVQHSAGQVVRVVR